IVLEPKLLLMDEPTANLDIKNIQVVEEILKKINSENGTTIIFTTHDLSQAYRLTDKVIMLLDGKVIPKNLENILDSFFGEVL
ncbi:MAG: phosphate ABC transporter ATP-binding protein, partial [Candidatus Poribacteria bacterium]